MTEPGASSAPTRALGSLMLVAGAAARVAARHPQRAVGLLAEAAAALALGILLLGGGASAVARMVPDAAAARVVPERTAEAKQAPLPPDRGGADRGVVAMERPAGALQLAQAATPDAAPLLDRQATPPAEPAWRAPVFVQMQAPDGALMALAVQQAVRVARLENQTIIDTTTFVQLQTREGVDAVARRLIGAGLPMVALTDLTGARTYVAIGRVVAVRPSNERHALGARASLVVDGLRFSRDLAVRETMEEVMAAIGRAGRGGPGP